MRPGSNSTSVPTIPACSPRSRARSTSSSGRSIPGSPWSGTSSGIGRPAASIPHHPLVRAAEDALSEVGTPSRSVATSTDANAAHARGVPAIAVGVTTGIGRAHCAGMDRDRSDRGRCARPRPDGRAIRGADGVNPRSGVVLQGAYPPDAFRSMVERIDALGYTNLWLTDSSLHARNSYAYLTLAAMASPRLLLGTAVTNPLTRHPAITAVAAATVDEISEGRIDPGDRCGRPAPPGARVATRSARLGPSGDPDLPRAVVGRRRVDRRPGVRAPRCAPPVPRPSRHPRLRRRERPEDPRARGRGRRRRDPPRRVVPGGARLGVGSRGSRCRDGGSAAAPCRGVRVRRDRRRRRPRRSPRPARSRRGSRRRLPRSANSPASHRPSSNGCGSGTRVASSRRRRKPHACSRTTSFGWSRSPAIGSRHGSGSRRWSPRAADSVHVFPLGANPMRTIETFAGCFREVSEGAAR